MAKQTGSNPIHGTITEGSYTLINDPSQLRIRIASYYSLFSDNLDNQPTVTSPRLDDEGLGLIVSACLPVRPMNVLKGVTCIDISLSEILSDIFYLEYGTYSYAFISDYKSRCIMHPLLPNPVHYGRSVFLDIDDLETRSDVRLNVLPLMKRGQPGNLTLEQNDFIRARGNSTTDGVMTVKQRAHYHWKQIRFTNFSLCVVTSDKDVSVTVRERGLFIKHFVYHRLDLMDDIQTCRYNDRLSTTEHAVVKLSAKAFENPYEEYLHVTETPGRVDNYQLYFTNPDKVQDDKATIKYVTKQMLAVTEPIDDIWKQVSLSDHSYVVWRYFADIFGSMRLYPGVAIPKNYDHSKRAWFLKGMSEASQGFNCLTTPYEDAFGAGIVVTLVRPITRVSVIPGNDDIVLGLIASDFKFSFLQHLVQDTFPECKNQMSACFIVDDSGFFVYHDDLHYEDLSSGYPYHITEKESDVSKYLMNEGKLTRKSCSEFGSKESLHTWRLNIDFNINHLDQEPPFSLFRVSKFNIYLGLKRKQPEAYDCACSRRGDSVRIGRCESAGSVDCQCPCYTEATFDECENRFGSNSRNTAACVPQPEDIGFNRLPNEIVPSEICYPELCNIHSNQIACDASATSCTWCSYNSTVGFCTDMTCPTIPPGIDTTVGAAPDSDDGGPAIGVIVGPVVCGVALIVLVVLLVLGLKGMLPCVDKGTTPETGRYKPDDNSDYDEPEGVINDVKPDVTNVQAMRPISSFSTTLSMTRSNASFIEDENYLHTNEVNPNNIRKTTTLDKPPIPHQNNPEMFF